MSDRLLRLVLGSDVRKNLMLHLLEGPVPMAEMRERLSIASSNLLPQLSKLNAENLVVRDNGTVTLTVTGSMLAKKLLALYALGRLIELNGKFLDEHDMTPIPENLLERIGELRDCKLIENSLENASATYAEVMDQMSKSKSVKIIAPTFDTYYPKQILSMVERKMPVSVILTENIFRVMEEGYTDVFKTYLGHENARLYVIDDARLALAVGGVFSSISLF